MIPRYDRIWRNARLATLAPGHDDLGIVEDGVVASLDGKIVQAGPIAGFAGIARETIDCEGRWITPGLIDCHTHLVHGGDRAQEFELRLAGATYQEIAAAGRRHPVDGGGDPGGERGCARRLGAAPRSPTSSPRA